MRILFHLLIFPLSLLGAVLMTSWPVEKRKHAKRNLFLSISLSMAAYLFIILATMRTYGDVVFSGASQDNDVFQTLLWCGIVFADMIVIVYVTRQVKLREALYAACCGYLAEHMAYCARNLLEAIHVFIAPGSFSYFLCLGIVYILVYQLFIKRIVHDAHYSPSALASLGLSLSVLGVVLFLSAEATRHGFVAIHSLYSLLWAVFVFVAQIKETKRIESERKLAFQSRLWQMQKAQYELSRENIDVINRKCHDLKHQVAALRFIQEDAERNAFIDSLESSVMIYDAILKTGNDVLDTVLTEKSLTCNQNGIVLSCMADGSLLDRMDAVDLYTLFGNALDNAIEAVMKLKEEERFIDLHVEEKAGLIIIEISNPCQDIEVNQDELPETSKQDKQSHGFGLLSMRMIVDKYDGVFKIEARDGLFILRVALEPEMVHKD